MKDKEQTKRKLIDAVGVIIKAEGYAALRVSKVAKKAAVDRKLVYRYFGNMNNLTEAYISENDYWVLFADHLKILSHSVDDSNSKLVITNVLQELFKFFLQEKEMQDLILMELSGTIPMMNSIHNFRESIGQSFLEATDSHFQGSEVNFRAVAALLVGGIYYTVLHTRKNGFHFADLNLRSEEGIKAIVETVSQVVNWAFIAALK
jgi:AcrR family transcriptional regulator